MKEIKTIEAKVISSERVPATSPNHPRTMMGMEKRRIQELTRQIERLKDRIDEKKKEIKIRIKRIKLYEQADELLETKSAPEMDSANTTQDRGTSTLSK
jgi:DUF438 domain-containing protein